MTLKAFPYDRNPWDRLPGESHQAYDAWRAYLAMEAPRSLRILAQQLHRNRTLLGGWSSRWRWQRRLEAFLRHQEEDRLRQVERDIREANRRHLRAAELLRNKAVERLESIDVNVLSPDSVVKMLSLAIQVERQALGMDKPPVAHASTKSNLAETSLCETRELTSPLRARILQFSPVSRNIMRQIVTKTLRIIQLETELAADEPPTLADIIGAEPADGVSKEVGSAGEPGTEPGA